MRGCEWCLRSFERSKKREGPWNWGKVGELSQKSSCKIEVEYCWENEHGVGGEGSQRV